MRHTDPDLDNLISANAILCCRRHSLFPHAQLLPALCPRRNLQLCASIDGRHLDLRSQRGFTDRDRNRDTNIVTFAVEHRMFFNTDDDEQIAWRAATSAGITFARDTDALPIARARFNAYFEWLGDADQAFSVTVRALVHDLAGSVTSRTRHVELHTAAGLRHLPRSLAIRTLLPRSHRSCAFAHWTQLLPRDIQLHY